MASSNEKQLYFFSAYDFKPEGVAHVKKQFEKELGKKNLSARHEYHHEDCYFIVRCWDVDEVQVYKLFHSVLRCLISQEQGSDDDTDDFGEIDDSKPLIDSDDEKLESSKISRRPRVGKDHRLPDSSKKLDESAPLPDISYPVEIRLFEIRKIWTCYDAMKSLDEIVPDAIIKAVEKNTGCRMLKDLNEQKIFIGAHCEEDSHIALQKLNVRKNFSLKASYINHIFYTEGTENVRVAVTPLLEVKKRLETTLFDWWAAQPLEVGRFVDPYKGLLTSFTVSCWIYDCVRAIYVPMKPSKLIAAVKNDDMSKQWDPWVNFKYCLKGEPEEDSQVAHEQDQLVILEDQDQNPIFAMMKGISLRDQDTDRVQKWLPGIAVGTSETNFQFPEDAAQCAPMPPAVTPANQQESRGGQPSWDTYRHFDSDGTQIEPLSVRRPSCPPPNSSALLNSRMESLAARSQATRTAPMSISHPNAPKPPFTRSKSGFQTVKSTQAVSKSTSRPNVSDHNEFPPLGSAKPKNTSAPRKSNQVGSNKFLPPDSLKPRSSQVKTSAGCTGSQALRTSLDQIHCLTGKPSPLDESLPRNRGPVQDAPAPSVPATQSQPHDLSSSLLDENITFQSSEYRVLEPVRRSESNADNTLQDTDEVSTRTYHNTMNQQTPNLWQGSDRNGHNKNAGESPMKMPSKLGDRLVDPLPEFATSSKTGFYKLLEGLQGYCGQLNVQSDFGRIVVKKFHKNGISTSMDPQELQNKLLRPKVDPGMGPHTFFTKVLTTIPADVQRMVDMKDAENKSLWEQKSPSWEIVYEFHCLEQKASEDVPFLIVIDAETFATSAKTEEQLLGELYIHCTKRNWDIRVTATGFESREKEYGEFANTIAHSLHVKSDSKPELVFELSKSDTQHIVNYVRVRRTCHYKSKDQKSILNVSEVQQLGTLSRLGPEEESTVYLVSTEGVGYYPPLEPGIEQLWYEAGISSTNGHSHFAGNKNLEVGDEAAWTRSILEREDIASATILPALWMIKEMDGVGFHNDNGRGFLARKAATTGASSTTAPQNGPYW